MKVEKKYLILIAGIVWFIAGFNITRIGVLASGGKWTIPMILVALGVYLLFHYMVFKKMVIKHTKRILGYGDEKHPIYKFFDKKAYLIMAFMMTFGISIRVLHLAPDLFIAVFYTGLGMSLVVAGISFLVNTVRYKTLLVDTSV